MDFLLHGIYDQETLETILSKNCVRIGFDLRARSPNLVPFHVLKNFISDMGSRQFYLTFENDRVETVLSFMDLLKDKESQIVLEFRDSRPLEYYQKIATPFFWFMNPEADWKGMLYLSHLKGVVLPTRFKTFYQTIPELWDIIERRQIEVFIHLDSFSELAKFDGESGLKISADLSAEIETTYRQVDQRRLRELEIWRWSNENLVGQ